ncbi:MAG: hypothetical protein V4650_03450 [Pseudomonadota bacterium]
MGKPAMISVGRTSAAATLLLALAASGAVLAQPGNNSPEQFGDRQTGQWGDPGAGTFGNPAAGNFDQSQMREPPPGTKALGRVSDGKRPEASPYLTLPTPADAATPVEPAPAAAATKKPVKSSKKKSTRKRKSAG